MAGETLKQDDRKNTHNLSASGANGRGNGNANGNGCPRLLSPPRTRSNKERRNPSITPRKFQRFFTPRSVASLHISPARKALRELATNQVNRRYQTPAPSSPLKPVSSSGATQIWEGDFENEPQTKRRKVRHTPESSPCRPPPQLISPCHTDVDIDSTKPALLSPIRSVMSGQETLDESDPDYSEDEYLPLPDRPLRRLTPLTNRNLTGRLAQRQLGGMPKAGRSYMSFPSPDWRVNTADFYSRPPDAHTCASHDVRGTCIPFCVAACHRSGLTAVGDEEGRVRLLDSSTDSGEPFSKIHLTFEAHENAIIDLDFSDDDYLLATASGDQTGRVVDMMTRTTVAFLSQHTASLKQIRFQPGQANSSVLATSSRDGSVCIWDLRCSRIVQDIPPPGDHPTELVVRQPPTRRGYAVNSFHDAHSRTPRQLRLQGHTDVPSRAELPGRVGAVSVTALQFLPPGQEHLLLTACEADASIRLWDIRSTSTSRNKAPVPLSTAAPPESHSKWRPFGISSLTLGSDASRLYALCKDNTVYAYSTAHLILGHAPELSTRSTDPPRRRHNTVTQNSLGPLYGFRHPSFHATSFYVKCAVRPAKDGRSEVLAVGSSDNAAVLFPTQDRFLEDTLADNVAAMTLDNSTIASTANPSTHSPPAANTRAASAGLRRSLFARQGARQAEKRPMNLSASRFADTVPIMRAGTALVRGHEREVGALTWTNEGKLVTVGDDCLIRCWSEGREEAADLRTGGETGGRRWACGWADVGEDWDLVDDEED